MTRIYWVAPLACVCACILPDREIIIAGNVNEHAVRIVEPTYLSPQARRAICEHTRGEMKSCESQLGLEPLPHHLSPQEFRFCRCADHLAYDPNRLPSLRILVEEEDQDPLYAALLLDSRASQRQAAYWEYFSSLAHPGHRLASHPTLPLDPSLHRNHAAPLREIVFGGPQGLDLCNASERISIEPGWHTLTVLVSDRPWFVAKDSQSMQYAIPDVAQGATFARAEYSFYCHQETPTLADSCRCSPKTPGTQD